jgi:hypothetical protein
VSRPAVSPKLKTIGLPRFHFFPFFRRDRAEAGDDDPTPALAANLADVLVGPGGGASMLTVDLLRREGVVRTITFTAAAVLLGVEIMSSSGGTDESDEDERRVRSSDWLDNLRFRPVPTVEEGPEVVPATSGIRPA